MRAIPSSAPPTRASGPDRGDQTSHTSGGGSFAPLICSATKPPGTATIPRSAPRSPCVPTRSAGSSTESARDEPVWAMSAWAAPLRQGDGLGRRNSVRARERELDARCECRVDGADGLWTCASTADMRSGGGVAAGRPVIFRPTSGPSLTRSTVKLRAQLDPEHRLEVQCGRGQVAHTRKPPLK